MSVRYGGALMLGWTSGRPGHLTRSAKAVARRTFLTIASRGGHSLSSCWNGPGPGSGRTPNSLIQSTTTAPLMPATRLGRLEDAPELVAVGPVRVAGQVASRQVLEDHVGPPGAAGRRRAGPRQGMLEPGQRQEGAAAAAVRVNRIRGEWLPDAADQRTVFAEASGSRIVAVEQTALHRLPLGSRPHLLCEAPAARR